MFNVTASPSTEEAIPGGGRWLFTQSDGGGRWLFASESVETYSRGGGRWL